MTIERYIRAGVLVFLVACSSDEKGLQLWGDQAEPSPGAPDGGATDGPLGDYGRSISRVDPILEGRKYEVELRKPLAPIGMFDFEMSGETGQIVNTAYDVTLPEPSWETHEISFDEAPRTNPRAIDLTP